MSHSKAGESSRKPACLDGGQLELAVLHLLLEARQVGPGLRVHIQRGDACSRAIYLLLSASELRMQCALGGCSLCKNATHFPARTWPIHAPCYGLAHLLVSGAVPVEMQGSLQGCSAM